MTGFLAKPTIRWCVQECLLSVGPHGSIAVPANGRNRRVSPVAAHSADRLLSEPQPALSLVARLGMVVPPVFYRKLPRGPAGIRERSGTRPALCRSEKRTAVVCVSAFAQQPPPDVKQKVDSLIAKLRDAYVKNDAAAFARALTELQMTWRDRRHYPIASNQTKPEIRRPSPVSGPRATSPSRSRYAST
jgi:hypothetical protein